MTLTKGCEYYYFPFNLEGANSRAIAHLIGKKHEAVLAHLVKSSRYKLTLVNIQHTTRKGNTFHVEAYTMNKESWVLYLSQYDNPYRDTIMGQLLEGCTLKEVVLPTDKVKS